MSKKQQESPTITVGEYKIYHKYKEQALIPTNFLQDEFFKLNPRNLADMMLLINAVFITLDNVKVKLEYSGTWNNSDGKQDYELDKITKDLYNMPLSEMITYAERRVGKISGYWYKIKMIKI